jgi:hypothetical protein
MKRSPNAAVVSLGAALGVLAATAGGTQTPAPQYFVLHQERAKPSMVKEYESTTKEFVALVKANKAKMPHFSFNAFVSPDFLYSYVSPIPDLAGLDAINADFGALAQFAGSALSDFNKRAGWPWSTWTSPSSSGCRSRATRPRSRGWSRAARATTTTASTT